MLTLLLGGGWTSVAGQGKNWHGSLATGASLWANKLTITRAISPTLATPHSNQRLKATHGGLGLGGATWAV